MRYKAIGYHGTSIDGKDTIFKKGIDLKRRSDDVFLGCGFYLWRDSYTRAKTWRKSEVVLEVELDVKQENILNFTTSEQNNEKKILEIYFKYFESKKIYFGEFIDFLIDNEVNIHLVTILDLTNKHIIFPTQDPYKSTDKSVLAYGDIQICIKNEKAIFGKIKETLCK
jgi:hypothetical protein